MSEMKCPACWNAIPEEVEFCPYCGFKLKTPSNQTVSENSSFPTGTPYVQIPNSAAGVPKPNRDSKSKNKVFLGAAIAVIAVIALIGIINSGSKKKTYSSDYAYDYDYEAPAQTAYYAKTGNEGALNKALSYLRSMAFSYTGLIEQLEYEGFSHSEAVYGADHCGANWKEQALLKAKSYLNSSSFSESGLVEQLEYEGFTSEEARYGVARCGADWKQQAVKKAASYLRSRSGWSRSELIDQLEYEGFTYDQASYGVKQNGL